MTTWNAAPMPELGLELVRDVDRERIRSRLPRWDPRLWGDSQFSKNTRPGNRLLKLGLAWGRERVKARKLQQENITPTGDIAPVSRFTGKEEDVEVGLQYFGKRYLSPYLGRWISADPLTIHGLGGDLNLYAYVSGHVLKATDPLGLETDENGVRVGATTVHTVEVGADGEVSYTFKESSTAAKTIAAPAAWAPPNLIGGTTVDENGALDTAAPEREAQPLAPVPDGLEEGLANVILQKITGQDLLQMATDKPPEGWKPLRPFPNGDDTLGQVMVEGFMLGLGSGGGSARMALNYPKLSLNFSRAAESSAIRITEKGIARVENHLAQLGALGEPENAAMVGRLKLGETSLQDVNFYMHELKESTIMRRAQSYGSYEGARAGHLETLQWQGIPYAPGYESQLYHPDVIRAFKEVFNPAAWPK